MDDKKERIIKDLELWAKVIGMKLPHPAEVIAELELQGHVVDLVTGKVAINGANMRLGEMEFIDFDEAMKLLETR